MLNIFARNKNLNTNLSSYKSSIKPIVLLILDGWGVAPASEGNAVFKAKPTYYNRLLKSYTSGQLVASGEVVGLTANEEGNSEVGHLTLGAGRVVHQSLVRINKAILDGSFLNNQALLSAAAHARESGSNLHVLGLVSSGDVHSSMNHFWALLELLGKESLPNIYLHLFTDGRDAPPREGGRIITEIEERIAKMKGVKIATVSGRYYAMDRDRRWDRIERVYKAMVLGEGVKVKSAIEAVEAAYTKNLTDEFVEPSIVVQSHSDDGSSLLGGPSGQPVAKLAVDQNANSAGSPDASLPVGLINDNDAVIFFNFRIDRPRELTMAFTMENFENLQGFEFGYNPHHEEGAPSASKDGLVTEHTFDRVKKLKNLFFTSMTEYQKNIPVNAIAFPPITVTNSLPEVLSGKSVNQLHLAESEKERMVTYYFDGMNENGVKGEDVIIVPSPKVSTYDKKPGMSTFEIVEKLHDALITGKYGFVVVNFACPDMVAHTGKMKPAMAAVRAADTGMGQIANMVLSLEGTLIVTADHGNIEEMIKYSTEGFYFTSGKGEVDTKHSNNPVPVIFIGKVFAGKKIGEVRGRLPDVAPTILSLMEIEKPPEMTGENLLK